MAVQKSYRERMADVAKRKEANKKMVAERKAAKETKKERGERNIAIYGEK